MNKVLFTILQIFMDWLCGIFSNVIHNCAVIHSFTSMFLTSADIVGKLKAQSVKMRSKMKDIFWFRFLLGQN